MNIWLNVACSLKSVRLQMHYTHTFQSIFWFLTVLYKTANIIVSIHFTLYPYPQFHLTLNFLSQRPAYRGNAAVRPHPCHLQSRSNTSKRHASRNEQQDSHNIYPICKWHCYHRCQWWWKVNYYSGYCYIMLHEHEYRMLQISLCQHWCYCLHSHDSNLIIYKLSTLKKKKNMLCIQTGVTMLQHQHSDECDAMKKETLALYDTLLSVCHCTKSYNVFLSYSEK